MSEDAAAFRGEDESAGAAPPALDLAAAVFLFALGIFFAVLSLALPVPGKVLTAPGLLPFVTSASLAVMAALLGLSAWRRRATAAADTDSAHGESARRFASVAAITVYLAVLSVLDAESFLPIFGHQIPVGGFEPATAFLLSVLLRLFWTERLAPVVSVSVAWTVCLSLAFRGLFGIPLPG